MLELHIWGPAFGLPSIDVECLATICYLHSVLPNDSWRLIPSSNPDLNPFRQLPALQHDSVWIAGFDQITQYLSQQEAESLNLDKDLDDAQSADCDAYKSFLYSRGLPLLDLSLYVSSENYTNSTRSALGELLAWPQSWIVPHDLRNRARRRSEHLGLSALDVDSAQEEANEDTGLAAKIPKSLRKPKQTVSGLLGRSAQKIRFRLDAVTEDFLEPLDAKLASGQWLIIDKACSADCLAIAILSLMQRPELPHAWLRQALATKYSRLGAWVRSCAPPMYGDAVSVSAVMKGDFKGSALPWQAPNPLSWHELSHIALEVIVSSVPLLRSGYERHEVSDQVVGTIQADKQQRKQMIYTKMRAQQQLYSQVIVAGLGFTSVVGWMVHTGLLTMSRIRYTKPPRRSFGEAGAFLGL